MNGTEALRLQMDRIQSWSLGVGIVVMLVCVVGAFSNVRQFFFSYLVGFLFWLGVALGCAAILMLHHLVGGGWGFIIRRLLESGTRTTPLMALLMVPILFGLPQLYDWTNRAPAEQNSLLHFRGTWLSVGFFVVRAAVYFSIWLAFAYYLNKWSSEEDRSGELSASLRLRALSGPGIVLYCLTATFAAVDWVMSLIPEWSSTSFGFLFIVSEVLTALAFVVCAAMLLADQEPLSSAISRQRLIDLGNLILTFVMLWAYIAFTQFLIIWAGNLPEEISWYKVHIRGGWMLVVMVLFLFHFVLPFLLLLFRDVKGKARTLAAIAGALLLVRLVDVWWTVEPVTQPMIRLHWMDVLAPIGMGGIWIAVFVSQLKGRPLLPLHSGFAGLAPKSEEN